MAKKSPPDHLKPNFSVKAELTADQKLAQKLKGLSEKSRDEYSKVCEHQDRAMEHFKEEIFEQREFQIERLTRDIMDQKITENRLTLNPPSAHSNRSLEKLAREEATIKIDVEGERRVSAAEARYFQERYNTIEMLQLKEQCLTDFKSSRGSKSTTMIDRDEGNER